MSIVTLLTNLRRVYPGDGYRMRFTGGPDAETTYLAFRRMESFNDGLSDMRRYRIITPSAQTMIAAQDETAAIGLLQEIGITDTEIEKVLTDMLIEASMVIDLKNEVRAKLLDEELVKRGTIKKANIETKFEAVKDDPLALAEFITGLASGEEAKPTLTEVPNDDS